MSWGVDFYFLYGKCAVIRARSIMYSLIFR